MLKSILFIYFFGNGSSSGITYYVSFVKKEVPMGELSKSPLSNIEFAIYNDLISIIIIIIYNL